MNTEVKRRMKEVLVTKFDAVKCKILPTTC
jgi:hypothetical protein